MPIPSDLLEVLACPKCKGEVRYDAEREAVLCESCRLAYRIEDGIPVMLVDEATPLE